MNFPVDKVWLVGHKPKWANAEHIEQAPTREPKYRRITEALVLAARCPDVSDEFVLVDDDFFILEPLPQIPVVHRGPLAEMTYTYGDFRDVPALCTAWGITAPLSYELHLPIVLHKVRLLEVLALAAGRGAGHTRTLYGNLYGLGGQLMDDVKVHDPKAEPDVSSPFLSTNDTSFLRSKTGDFIRERFSEPSPWEA